MIARRRYVSRLVSQVATVAVAALAILLASGALALATPSGVHVRVEGARHTLYSGTVAGLPSVMTDSDGGLHDVDGNALWALEYASRMGAFPYVLKDMSWGLFIDSVGGELPLAEAPYPGWMYRVNGVSPMVGAADYALASGDDVLWYYGTYDASPTAVALPTTPVSTAATVTITAQQLDPNGVASPLPGATVYVGSTVMTADNAGQVRFHTSQPGDYGVRVESAGLIRSAVRTLHMRRPAAFTKVSLSAGTIRLGSASVFAARLQSGSAYVVGRNVKIYARRATSSTWSYVATRRTGSTGVASLTVRPRTSTYYRAVWVGDSTYLDAHTTSVKVTVRR